MLYFIRQISTELLLKNVHLLLMNVLVFTAIKLTIIFNSGILMIVVCQ